MCYLQKKRKEKKKKKKEIVVLKVEKSKIKDHNI